MLDTNTVSSLLRQNLNVGKRITSIPMDCLCLSAISEGELLYGLAKKPGAKNLHKAVQEFLKRIDVLSWNSQVAEHYGKLRAELEVKGNIAAHAFQVGATLVTNDRAFNMVKKLKIEDWTLES